MEIKEKYEVVDGFRILGYITFCETSRRYVFTCCYEDWKFSPNELRMLVNKLEELQDDLMSF